VRNRLLGFNDNGLEFLEGDDGDVRSICVKLLLGVLVVISPPLKSDSDPVRYVLDTLGPKLLVELGVESDIIGAHGLLSKVDYGLDGPWCALLE